MTAQRHEIEAWLGDDHGLTDAQVGQLVTIADDLAGQYPDPGDADLRDAALTAAYRVTAGDVSVVGELAAQRVAARLAEARALAGLRQAALCLISARAETEAGFAKRAGVDRMAVRGWLGKR
jgi:hypothetical protein